MLIEFLQNQTTQQQRDMKKILTVYNGNKRYAYYLSAMIFGDISP
jgi:hypothetical protein